MFAIRLGMPPSCDRCVMAQKLSELPWDDSFRPGASFHQNKSKIRIHSTSVFVLYLFCLTLYYVEAELCKSSTYKEDTQLLRFLSKNIFKQERTYFQLCWCGNCWLRRSPSPDCKLFNCCHFRNPPSLSAEKMRNVLILGDVSKT